MSLCLEKPELSLFSWVTVHSSSGPALAIVLLFCAQPTPPARPGSGSVRGDADPLSALGG